jgi:xanthine/CO dehydrogenase XdhC/CoxF family maturation factor
MTERAIIDHATRLRREREAHLVATIVRAEGLRVGARMLLTQFRWMTSSSSGVSLESELANTGWDRTRHGETFVLRCEAPDGDLCSAFGLDGEGPVEILVERAGVPGRIDPLELSERCLRTQRRGAVATIIGGGKVGARVALIAGADPTGEIEDVAVRGAMIEDCRRAIECGESRTNHHGNVEWYVEAILPPPRIFVFGIGHDAAPIVQLARAIGWDVAVCAHEARHATRTRFPQADEILVGSAADLAARVDECDRAVALVMSHRYELDRDNLGALVGTRVRYIGVPGARGRTEKMLGELCLGLDDARIHAPVGLDLGAQTAHEQALAIIAEVQAVLRRAPAVSPLPLRHAA